MEDLTQLILESGLFEADWYQHTYPDVHLSGLAPLRHFIAYGMELGRAPGPGFDPGFYATQYPDVDGQALRHYLVHGRAEERLPTFAAARLRSGMARVRQLQAELWGGLEAAAEAALLALLEDPDQPEQIRFAAGCQLAYWLDFSGAAGTARQVLERLGGMSEPQAFSAARLIPLSALYARDQSPGAIRAARAACLAIRPGDRAASRTLALANLAATDQERLALINRLYTDLGLAGLELRNPAAPLTLENLTTMARGGTASDLVDPQPRVSVIVPVYNGADTIGTALYSLCQQSYRNIEIIVVDDASQDDTFDRVQALAARDSRIVPLRLTQNGGAYAARNAGLRKARGNFITTHDADDWSHAQKIELQVAELNRDPALIGVIAHWARVRRPLHLTSNWRLGPDLLQWSHSSFLFRKEAATRLGGWEQVKVSGDMEYIWRLEAAYGPHTVRRILPEVPLAFALDTAGSLTRSPHTHVSTIYRGLRHYYRAISRYWHDVAPAGLSAAQRALKHSMLPGAIWPGQDGSDQVALLLRGDCCDPNVIAQMIAAARRDPTQRIAISHHPSPGFDGRRTSYAMEFDPGFFTLWQAGNVALACPEEKVTAAEVRSL